MTGIELLYLYKFYGAQELRFKQVRGILISPVPILPPSSTTGYQRCAFLKE
jgi:hypothetical protein